MSSSESAKTAGFDRYLRVVLGAVALYLLVVAPLNLLVDPHDTFPGLQLRRFEPHRQWKSRITKANAGARGGAQLAVLGSSRAAQAFRPRGASTPDRAFLNLAVQETSLRELQAIARFLFLHNRPRELVIGVEFDYFDFDFIPDEFLKSRFNPALNASEVIFEQALGEYALEKSLQTFRAASTPDPDLLLSRRRKFELLLDDPMVLALDLPPPAHYAKAELARLHQVVELATQHGTRVSVVMMPVHATTLIAYERAGLWARFETWKRDVLALLSDTNATIWDFNQLAPHQTEPVPEVGAADQEMRWYTDASHCTPRYGEQILARVLSRDPHAQDDDALATVLRANTLEAHLARIRARKQALFTSALPLVALVDEVLENDRRARSQRH